MPYEDSFLDQKLQARITNHSLRRLVQLPAMRDFCSNDYLGIKTGNLVQAAFSGNELHGAGGARTLAGNYPLIEQTEAMLAAFHATEAALVFNSGYNANLGLMSCVAGKGDTILFDQLSHASLRDGIRLSFADSFSFRHNDLEDLTHKLQKAKGNIFVVTESLFSMDGDFAPLPGIAALCNQYGAHLIVDEAHATGVVGKKGEGLAQHLGMERSLFARVHTFGKAVGVHGAVICGSERLKSYLINFCRSFIFTTALPETAIKAIAAAYDIFPGMDQERKQLQSLINHFQQATLSHEKLNSQSPVQAVIIPGNEAVKKAANQLQAAGFDIRPILYPTVPKGRERLRISLHAFNQVEELDMICKVLQ